MLKAFETRVPGKWVLAGEHSVLKGHPAIALPHPEFGLSLRYEPGAGGSPLAVEPLEAKSLLEDLARSILGSGLGSGELSSGRLKLESTIPIGAGLGSSAALCVALTRWLGPTVGLAPHQTFEFARRLEDRFHGKSSGMDVAVLLANGPVRFTMSEGASLVFADQASKLPRFTFHDTGLRSSTRDCVALVDSFRLEQAERAQAVDLRMGAASLQAHAGLLAFAEGKTEPGLALLEKAIQSAQSCFEEWGLVPASIQEQLASILDQGARAAKLTGAGRGGMIVALWNPEKP